MNFFFATWLRAIQKNPVVFNSLTGCGLCASSDVGAQYLEHTQDTPTTTANISSSSIEETTTSFRIRRVLSAAAIGAFFGGWVYPAAYARIDALWKGTHFSAVLQKSVFEIATVGIFVNSVSMTSRGILVGRDTNAVTAHLVEEMPSVTLNDARVWLPYNFFAFMWIPAPIRPTTTLMMEAGWQTYISLMSNNYNGDTGKAIASATNDEHVSSSLGLLNNPTKAVIATAPK